MKNVNELNIKITKAVITGISVELDFDTKEPTWTINGKLVTSAGKAISSFGFSTHRWSDNKITVPMSANLSGRALFEIFTPVIMEKLGETFKALPAPRKAKKVVEEKTM